MVKIQCKNCKEWFSPKDIAVLDLKKKLSLCKECHKTGDKHMQTLNNEPTTECPISGEVTYSYCLECVKFSDCAVRLRFNQKKTPVMNKAGL